MLNKITEKQIILGENLIKVHIVHNEKGIQKCIYLQKIHMDFHAHSN